MNKRIKVIFSIFCIWLVLVGLRLWSLQVVNHKHYIELAQRNRIRIVRISASRGRIFDRNGILLVDNKVATQLVVIAEEILDKEELIKKLSSITSFRPEYIIKKIKENIFKPFIPAVLADNMDEQMLVRVSEARPVLSGISVQVRPIRNYLFGEVMSHLIGYVGEVTQEELRKGYRWNDIIGRTGIEKTYDVKLQGSVGYKEMQVDHRGNIDRVLNTIEPCQGSDIFLTIDSRLQELLCKLFDKKSGAGIVMNPQTGEVLAIMSVPGFPPNKFISPVKADVVSRIFQDKRRPMINRAVQGLYAPGSVFKIVVALAALEEGVITRKKLFYCDGEFKLGNASFGCWGKHSWVDLSKAIKKSCNEYFYQVGLKCGQAPIVDVARRFGLGKKTGIELPGEKKGLLPKKDIDWYPGDTVNLSIGHGHILVTPIQIACMVSAIANGGTYYRPRLVMGEESDSVEVEIDRDYLDLVKKALLRVVKEPDGTGHRAYVKGLDIAGKTGTVELKKGKTVTWFVGFAPFSDPQAVVVIVTEGGESGGVTAAPIAQKVFKEWMDIQKESTIHDLSRQVEKG